MTYDLSKRPTRTSYSAISTFESCEASYLFGYILATEEYQPGEAASRGIRLHKSGELYLKGELPFEDLPVDYWRVKQEMFNMKNAKAKSEEVICVNRDWKIVPSKGPGVFIKAVVDIHWFERKPQILHVRDLKTGNIYRADHIDQLQLYGTMALVKYPRAKEVRVGGLYIDHGKHDCEAVYPRKMLPMLINHWTERALKVLTATEFPPKPSPDNCKYCPHNGKKGGPCAAGV